MSTDNPIQSSSVQGLSDLFKEQRQKDIVRNRTKLSPDQEKNFQNFYTNWATKAGIDTNPDNPAHKYDYRGAWLAGSRPDSQTNHWDSQWKDPDHPNRYVDGIDTITGKKGQVSHEVSPPQTSSILGLSDLFNKEPIVDSNATYMSAAPSTPYIPKSLPLTKYTGSKGEEYLSQFMGNVAQGLSQDYIKASPPQGLPGETAVRVAGRIVGSTPAIMFGSGMISAGIKGAISKLPQAAKAIVSVARGLFTEEAVRGTINNSVDFYNALKSGDTDAVEHAAAGAIVDTVFTALMAKGWIDDAKAIKGLWETELNRRAGVAKNITPEPPKTLAENVDQIKATPQEPQGPSPELQAKVDVNDQIVEMKTKIKDAKVRPEITWPPKTEEQQITAARAFKAAMPGKEELIANWRAAKAAELAAPTQPKAGLTTEAQPVGVPTKPITTNEAYTVLTKTPEYIEQNKLYNERSKMDEVPFNKRDTTYEKKRTDLNKRISDLGDQIYNLPESKVWSRLEKADRLTADQVTLARQEKVDLSNKANWNNAPQHGTDIDKLEDILKYGLRSGTALDYSPKRDWASEYPVQIIVPSAKKGKMIEHNGYYISANAVRAAKVVINLDQYVDAGAERIVKEVDRLRTEYPNVDFQIKGQPVEAKPKLTPEQAKVKLASAILQGETTIPTKPGPTVDWFGEAAKRDTEIANQQILNREVKPVTPEEKVAVLAKPTEPSTGVMVTPEDIKTLEEHFGSNWDERTDKELADFLKTKTGPEIKPIEEKPLITDNDVENFYGKPLSEISQSEIDTFTDNWLAKNESVKSEPITEVDLQTGTPEPSQLVGEQSIFNSDKETTDIRTKLYNVKSVAYSINEALNQLPDRPIKDIFVTAQKLANDVNRWRYGEDIDIDETRNFLSKIAIRADEFRNQIIANGGGEQDFFEWKDLVSEMANWARKTDRLKIKSTEGTSLYSGIPVDKIKQVIGTKTFRDSMISDEKVKGMKSHEVYREIREELVRALVERSGNISKVLTSPKFYNTYGDIGFRTIRNMNLSRGGTPRATNSYRQFAKEVYGGLSRNESKVIDRLAMAVRMVDIGKYKTEKQFSFPEGKDPVSSSSYLKNFAVEEGLTPEKAYELYHEDEKGNIGGRVGAGFEATKRSITDMRDEAGGLIGTKEHDDLVAHRYRRLGTIEKPSTLAEIFDKKYEQTIGDIKRSVYDSGVEILPKGKETDIFESSWKLMAYETFTRAYGRLANNEAGHTLLELATEHPNNSFIRTKIRPSEKLSEQPIRRQGLIDSIEIKRLEQGVSDYEIRSIVNNATKVVGTGVTSKVNKASVDALKIVDKVLGDVSKGYTGVGEKIPDGYIPTYVYNKGHRTTVWMEPSFAKEWIVSSKDITPRAARIVKWATMAPVTRMFATGIEPSFAFTNPFRDVLQIWFAAREFKMGQWKPVYSSQIAMFSAQISTDLAEVASDTLSQTGWYNDYIKYGGGMDFLTLQSRPFQRGLHIDSSVDNVFRFAGYLNESSEILTRLAIMKRALYNQATEGGISLDVARKNPEMMRNAVFAARDYMDFAQGGWAVKLIDQGVPFFNASLVAGRTFVRSFKANGMNAQSWWKLAQFSLLVGGLYLTSKYKSPKTMEEIEGDVRTQNNFILPLGDWAGFEDESGQMVYPFLMIPVDQSLRFLKKFTEFCADDTAGNKKDARGTLMALKQMSPLDINSLPPLESAIFEYFANYDLYKMKAIRKENEVFGWPKSQTEFGADTPQALIDIGKVTGASPERIKLAMSEMISNNSIWAQILGEGYNRIFSQMPEDLRHQNLTESLSRWPIIRRFIGLTNPYSKFSDTVDKSNEESTWERFNQRNGLDILINGYLTKKSESEVYTPSGKFKTTRDGIEEYMRSFEDNQVYKRLNDRLIFAEEIQNIPHRTLWMKMEAQSNDARAKTYVKEIMNNDRMVEEFDAVNSKLSNTKRGGLRTQGFNEALNNILSK